MGSESAAQVPSTAELTGAAAREARKKRLAAEPAAPSAEESGAAARQARKERLAAAPSVEESGAAARQARKDKLAGEQKLKEDAEVARVKKIAEAMDQKRAKPPSLPTAAEEAAAADAKEKEAAIAKEKEKEAAPALPKAADGQEERPPLPRKRKGGPPAAEEAAATDGKEKEAAAANGKAKKADRKEEKAVAEDRKSDKAAAEDKKIAAEPVSEEEARRLRLAEKIAARRAAAEKERAVADLSSDSEAEKGKAEPAKPGAAAGALAEDEIPEAVRKLMSKRKAEESSSSSSEAGEAGEAASEAKKLKQLETRKELKKLKQLKIDEEQKRQKKQKKKEKKLRKKQKKGSSSSSGSRSPSMTAIRMAKEMANAEMAGFSWERPNTSAATAPVVVMAGVGATEQEVDVFLSKATRIDPTSAEKFRMLAPALQKLVIDVGPIHNSQNPSSVLMGRALAAQRGELGTPGQMAKAENPKIEAMIAKFGLDGNVAARLRNMTTTHQTIALEMLPMKELTEASNPSGMIMFKLNEMKVPEARALVAFR